MRVLTQNRANTLECTRMRRRSPKRSEPAMPWQTGLTGSADRSDRCGAENREDLETRAREGPVGACAARVALRSAGHSERLQTP